jgi:hypothetical protein
MVKQNENKSKDGVYRENITPVKQMMQASYCKKQNESPYETSPEIDTALAYTIHLNKKAETKKKRKDGKKLSTKKEIYKQINSLI